MSVADVGVAESSAKLRASRGAELPLASLTLYNPATSTYLPLQLVWSESIFIAC
jgi:hypothetical protein